MPISVERLTQALAGAYAIKEELGRGGMAIVFLAHDVKHDRDVAVKVFHAEVASLIGADRFLQEIRITAVLQHPHILPLFDSGIVDGFLFYVMPFIEGRTLRDLLQRDRQLPVETAVQITREVASALDYAHRHGVIHRDIKPENILLHDGQALVADFGIALAVTSATGSRLTATGLSLGTPQYMSPEQVLGDRLVDGRSDLYSLCAVLYEMLAGNPPFEGPSAQAVASKILTNQVPSVREQRSTVPVEIAMTLERGLARLPADRFQSARELSDALGGTLTPRRLGAMPSERVRSRLLLPFGVAFGMALGALGAWTIGREVAGTGIASIPTVRFTIDLPAGAPLVPDEMANVAISRDGTELVYVAATDRGAFVYARSLKDPGFSELHGTENSLGPFFSPDGASIGFFAGGKLRKLALHGGAPVDLADAALPRGASWTLMHTILYTSAPGSGLRSVPDTGGQPNVVTRLDSAAGERTHRFPIMDDRGRVFATTRTGANSTFDQATLTMFGTSGTTRREIVNGGSQPRLLVGDLLVFLRSNTLYGVRLSRDHSRRAGEPVALIDSVMNDPSTGAAQYAVSDNGTLVYASGGEWHPSRFLTLLRDGQVVRLTGDARAFDTPRVSPNGGAIAVVVQAANDDIWILDPATGGTRRLTFEGGSNIAPTWDPTGTRIAFSSNLAGHHNMYLRLADGSDVPQRLAPSENIQFPSGWTPDGKSIAFTSGSIATGYDIWVCDVASRTARKFLSTSFNESGAVFSPDGRWVAYVSDETSQEEIYLRSYPDGANQHQISSGGGTNPVWGPGGRQLFYRRRSDLVAVDVTAGTVTTSSQRVVLSASLRPGRVAPLPSFDIHPKGGVVVVRDDKGALPTKLRVVAGWLTEVSSRLR